MSEDKGPRSANIFDVAKLAGVSHQTVSRVLNDLPNVRPATRERVERAIAQLRYSPSPAARALVTRRTRTIGLVVPGVSDYGPTSVGLHFNLAARRARYSVETVSSLDAGGASVRAAVESLLRQRVDAIVLIIADVAGLDVVRSLDLSIPVVAAASSARRDSHIVSIDQYRGARQAVRHLAEIGHTQILHVAGPATAADAVERIRGWRDELAAHRLVTAVANDQMSIGLLSALRERGLRVPEDISIVGFDDVPEAGYLFPPLTTVRQDFAALGELIMQKVLVAIEEPDRCAELCKSGCQHRRDR